MQVRHVEASDRGAARDVPGVASDALVAAAAEGLVALAGEDDHADRRVLARLLQGVADLDQRLGPEGVAHLGAVDRDLRDAVAGQLVADVLVIGRGSPVHGREPSGPCQDRKCDAVASASRGDAPRHDRRRRGRRCADVRGTARARSRRGDRVARGAAGRDRAAAGPGFRRRPARLPARGRRRGPGRPARTRAAPGRGDDRDRHPAGRVASGLAARRRLARPLRAGPRRPHLGNHGHAAAGRAHARPGPPERARRRRHPRPRPRRALALPAPAQPRGRVDGAVAVRDLCDDRGPRSRHARGRHDRVARPDPARAADRPPAPADAAGRDAGRRARGPHAARARPRGRLAGRADLRAHAGVLGGDGRPAGGHRDLRPPASRLDRRDRRRR